MSALTPEEIARIERYYAKIAGDDGMMSNIRAGLDPVGVSTMCRVARDVVGILGYRMVWIVSERRYRLRSNNEEGGS